MGDGVRTTYLIVIQGDKESRHIENVDRAIRCVTAEHSVDREDGALKIAVASTKKPKKTVDFYRLADEKGVEDLIEDVAKIADDDDHLVVYISGHGGESTWGGSSVNLAGSLYSYEDLMEELGKIRCASRFIYSDTCRSGGAISSFINDKSTVFTLGARGENVSCGLVKMGLVAELGLVLCIGFRTS